MNNALDVLFLRKPRIDYISPPVCEALFSSSGGPVIVLNPLTPQAFPTGLVFGGTGNFFLSWDAYPGALCYSVYKADTSDPFGSYTIVAECIPNPPFDTSTFGGGCFRISAITADGETPLSLPSCISESNPPFVQTDAASAIGETLATLNGEANPEGSETTVYFQWGLTVAYGNTTTPGSAGSGEVLVPFSFSISGLTGSTIYHFRAVATNSSGTAFGDDKQFTTQAPTPASVEVIDMTTIYDLSP
jgi:hypothetical protein